MISKDIYKRDLDTQKNQNTVPAAQQRGNDFKAFEDLKIKARIWSTVFYLPFLLTD